MKLERPRRWSRGSLKKLQWAKMGLNWSKLAKLVESNMLLEVTEKWKLTTQNNAYNMEANQISKQNRYPCLNTRMVLSTNNDNSIEVKC